MHSVLTSKRYCDLKNSTFSLTQHVLAKNVRRDLEFGLPSIWYKFNESFVISIDNMYTLIADAGVWSISTTFPRIDGWLWQPVPANPTSLWPIRFKLRTLGPSLYVLFSQHMIVRRCRFTPGKPFLPNNGEIDVSNDLGTDHVLGWTRFEYLYPDRQGGDLNRYFIIPSLTVGVQF